MKNVKLPDTNTLTEGLTSVLKNRGHTQDRVLVLDRQLNPYAAKNPSEIVTCQLDDGTRLRLLCKYAIELQTSKSERDDSASYYRHSQLYGGVAHEAETYTQVLQPTETTELECYGSYFDGSATWLIIDYLDKSIPVQDARPQKEALGLAAKWIGRFHAVNQRRVANGFRAHLDRLDDLYYLQYSRHILEGPKELHDCYPWLADVCREYEQTISVLVEHPPTIIHGDFYSDNTLYRGGFVYPIDWSCASIGVGELDLVMLTYEWPRDIAQHCEREYQRARWPEGVPADYERRVDIARLCLHFCWTWVEISKTLNKWPVWKLEALQTLAREAGLIRA